MTAREYANKKGIQYREHRDGSVTIKYKMTRNSSSLDDFTKRLLMPARGIQKRLDLTYVPDSRNFVWRDYPTVKVRMRFEPKKQSEV